MEDSDIEVSEISESDLDLKTAQMYKWRDWLFSYQSVILLVIFCPKAFFITRVEVSLDLSLGVILPVEVPIWFATERLSLPLVCSFFQVSNTKTLPTPSLPRFYSHNQLCQTWSCLNTPYSTLVVNIAKVMTKKRLSLILAPPLCSTPPIGTPKIEYIEHPERRLLHVLQSKLT